MAYPRIFVIIKEKLQTDFGEFTSIPLFIVLSLVIAWLYVLGESVLSAKYFDRETLSIHVFILLIFLSVYRYWARHGKTKTEIRRRNEKIKGIMEIPFFKAVPSLFVGSVAGGLIGWLLFHFVYGITEVIIPIPELLYLGIYEIVIVSGIETIVFVKIAYDIWAGVTDKDIATDKKFSVKAGLVSSFSATVFHIGVLGWFNISAFAWVFLWFYIFSRIARPIYIKWKGKQRQVPFTGLALVVGLHAFLNIFIRIYPLNIFGG